MTADHSPQLPDAVRPGAVRRFFRNPLGVTGLTILALTLLITLVAPIAAPFSPQATDLALVNAPPGDTYLLGGDSAGRDILSRLMWGGRSTFLGAAIVLVLATVVGVGTGLLAAYLGRFADAAFTWISEVLLAVPSIMVLIALFAVAGPNMPLSMLVFGVLVSPFLYRLVRSLAIEVRNEPYVEAAEVAGVSTVRILGRHVLRVIRGPIIVMIADIAATGVGIQASLEFLGFGGANTVSWGGMISDAFGSLYLSPMSVVWPGLLLTVVIGSFTLIGNAIRDALVPAAAPRRRRAPQKPAHDNAAPIDPAALLSVRGLSIGYPRADGDTNTVVSNVSFDVARGEIVGIVGESGSGKSQTVFSVLDLLPSSAIVLGGQIALEGTLLEPAQLRRLRGDRIAYVPQEPMVNLDPSFTIGHQLAVPLRRRQGLSRMQANQRALELLDAVGIREPQRVAGLYPHQISGGMAQRVLIAGAVSCDPDLLIADEPTTALDVTVQAEILELIRDQQRERGMSVLMVTHNLGVVADICDRVIVMRAGEVVESGDAITTLTAPTHPYTKELLAASLDDAPYRLRDAGAVT